MPYFTDADIRERIVAQLREEGISTPPLEAAIDAAVRVSDIAYSAAVMSMDVVLGPSLDRGALTARHLALQLVGSRLLALQREVLDAAEASGATTLDLEITND